MTTQTTFHQEPHLHRVQEFRLLIEMIVTAIESDLFTGAEREANAAALSRIAGKI